MTPSAYYLDNSEKYAKQLRTLKKRSALAAVFRLLSFLLATLSIYQHIKSPENYYVLSAIVFLIAFFVLVRISISISSNIKLLKELLFVNNNELNILQGQENGFSWDAGINNPAMHTTDMDIFGHRSLFHLLNRTTTAIGKKKLALLLNNPLVDPHQILERQQALHQFAPQTDIRQLITANGRIKKEEEGKIDEVITWIDTPNILQRKKWIQIIRYLLPILNISAFIYYLYTDTLAFLSLGIIISWIITGLHFKYINEQHTLTGKKSAILLQYSSILKHFCQTEVGSSSLLQSLQSTAGEAQQEILSLSKLTALLDHRLNLLINFFLNSFFLYDIQCILSLEKWKEKNTDKFREWINTVGEIEVLVSFASFVFNQPSNCIPEIQSGDPFISATALSHPLIMNSAQVSNNISIGKKEKLLIITGSNMSGKSTFLRTVGINLLLAQCGSVVCAKTFSFSPMRIFSSMKINDSLLNNTSYFMAELKRLHEIIEQLKEGSPALVLIDEVLRGTNSDDKTHGSAELITRLLTFNCLTLFATHDLSLSKLQNTYNKIGNYCFESLIENGELSFDYTLREGVATNKNATFLMKKMGIF